MAAADTAKLVASLSLDASAFDAGIKRVTGGLGSIEKKTGQINSRLGAFSGAINRNLARAVDSLAAGIVRGIGDGITSLQELEQVTNATAGAIKSTGGAAGVTAAQVRDLAQALESTTTADDKAIQNGENLLLTFTNIGKDVFPDATEAIVNMGIAFNKGSAEGADFSASAIQVGKALNDPIKGVTALSKVGVSFTKQQKDQIKKLTEAGKVMDAQKIILAELKKEFGEAGKAAGTGFSADISRAKDSIEDAEAALARGLLPAISKVSQALAKKLNDPKVLDTITKVGAALGDVATGLLDTLARLPWESIGNSLKIAGTGAKAILDAFLALPSWVQTAVITGWGLNKLSGGAITGLIGNLASGLIKGVLGIQAAQVNIQAATVTGLGGGVPGVAPAAGGTSLLSKVTSLILPAAVTISVATGAFAASGLFDPSHRIGPKGEIGRGTNDPKQQIANIIAGIKQLTPRAAGGDPVAQRQLAEQTALLQKLQGSAADTQRAITNSLGETPKLQNVTNERLEAIRGFAETSATAATTAKAAQVAAIQQASAAQVHTTERAEQNTADKINELNAQARTAAQLAAGDSRSEQAAVRAAAAQTASATVTAGGKAAAAGNVVATAVKNKDLSVTVNNKLTVSTRVSVTNDLNAKNNYKSVYNVAF